MPIPEAQLSRWANHSQTDTAIKAHKDIKKYLCDRGWLMSNGLALALLDFDIYLQGSYASTTNVFRDSDVDVVVELKTPFYYDVSQLSINEQIRFQAAHPPTSYTFWNFHQDVLAALRTAFGYYSVTPGNKAIKVPGKSGVKLDADVLACVRHRHYYSYNGNDTVGCHEGVTFFHQADHHQLINYPNQHLRNGIIKQAATGDRFKRTVRLFKNARNYLVDHGQFDAGKASSYFIQGMLYNVPARLFTDNFRDTFIGILRWLASPDIQREDFLCQNGLIRLFGDALDDPCGDRWRLTDFLGFMIALIDLDTNWA